MNTSERVRQKLAESLQPDHLELINESHLHAGPATESHFKVILVTANFEGLGRVQRHQHIYRLLQEELQANGNGTVHALALHLFTPKEWEKTSVPESPLCAGKNNH